MEQLTSMTSLPHLRAKHQWTGTRTIRLCSHYTGCEDTTSIRYVTLHLRDQRVTASLRLTEIAPKSPFLCVNWFSCRRKSYTIQCEHTLSCLQWTLRASWFSDFKSQVSSSPNEDMTHIMNDFPVIGDPCFAHRIMGSPGGEHCEKIYGVILWEGEVTVRWNFKFLCD